MEYEQGFRMRNTYAVRYKNIYTKRISYHIIYNYINDMIFLLFFKTIPINKHHWLMVFKKTDAFKDKTKNHTIIIIGSDVYGLWLRQYIKI